MKKPNIEKLYKRVNGKKLNLTDRIEAINQYSNLIRYVAYLENNKL